MAETQKRSQAEIIREALQIYVSSPRRPLPLGIGEFDSGETHGAERAKDFLRAAAMKGRWR
jgi:hypothetical protein